jgi:cytochrome c
MDLSTGARSALVELFGIGVLCGVVACGSDASQIEQGKQAVSTRACATCHQAMDGTLSGQTTPQPGTMAYPPNLTPDMDTGIGSWSVDQIVAAILTGVDDEGAHLCDPMPKFGAPPTNMTADEAKNIAAYLKSLAPVAHETPESMCAARSAGDMSAGTGGAAGAAGATGK